MPVVRCRWWVAGGGWWLVVGWWLMVGGSSAHPGACEYWQVPPSALGCARLSSAIVSQWLPPPPNAWAAPKPWRYRHRLGGSRPCASACGNSYGSNAGLQASTWAGPARQIKGVAEAKLLGGLGVWGWDGMGFGVVWLCLVGLGWGCGGHRNLTRSKPEMG